MRARGERSHREPVLARRTLAASLEQRSPAWRSRGGSLAITLGIALLLCTPASAHPTPGSLATLDFSVAGARLEQDVPIEELERALHVRLADPDESAAAIVSRHAQQLLDYAAQHVQASAENGDAWGVQLQSVSGHDASDGPRALFVYSLRAPAGQANRTLLLHDDLVAHEVVSHYTRVLVRSDWARGFHAGEPVLVGTIHAGRNDVTIARDGSFWRGFASVVSLGGAHIATGTDHLLFLFTLLLVAPVAAASGRWRGARSTRESLFALLRVVTAFSIGHSLTLALAALRVLQLPAAIVEAAIAASVLITAVHAARPLFAGREGLVAGVFGLVHGLGFASVLVGRELGRAQLLWTLLGFNLGIELAQLGLVCLVVPWLLLLARTRAYPGFRLVFAAVSGTCATCWLLERTLQLPDPSAAALAWLQTHPLQLLIALAAFTLCARLLPQRPQLNSG